MKVTQNTVSIFAHLVWEHFADRWFHSYWHFLVRPSMLCAALHSCAPRPTAASNSDKRQKQPCPCRASRQQRVQEEEENRLARYLCWHAKEFLQQTVDQQQRWRGKKSIWINKKASWYNIQNVLLENVKTISNAPSITLLFSFYTSYFSTWNTTHTISLTEVKSETHVS